MRIQNALTLAAALAALLLYWPTLHGPLFLDDLPTLSPILDWLEGRATATAVLFGNHTGPLGRPVAIASFLMNAALFGDSVFWLKAGNLLLHLLNGGLLLLFLKRLAALCPASVPNALPPVLVAVWILLPIHVSTVSYVVQRMTLLSATFVLAALFAFIAGLSAISANQLLRARALLLAAVPLLTMLAALSKENGVLAPLLCLPIAWLWWQEKRPSTRDLAIFFTLFLAVPAVAFIAVLAFQPSRLGLDGYLVRDFDMMERVLSQSRALADYAGSVFVPGNRTVSVFTDAYPVSRGLLEPASTLAASIFWSALVLLAFLLTKKRPLFSAGIFFFLLGHSMESSFFPLEVYFAHRNYLPSVGILLAASDVVVWLFAKRAGSWLTRKATFFPLLFILLLIESMQTAGFTRTFSSLESMTLAARSAYPESSRAALAFAGSAVERGEFEVALAELERLAETSNRESRQVGRVAYLATTCQAGVRPSNDQWTMAASEAGVHITRHAASAFQLLFTSMREVGCGDEFRLAAARLTEAYIDASTQPETISTREQLRLAAGNLLIDLNHTDEGLRHLVIAFEAGPSPASAGVNLLASLLADGRYPDAKRRLEQLRSIASPQDSSTQDFIKRADEVINAWQRAESDG